MFLGLTAKYLMWVVIVVLIQDGSEHVQPTVQSFRTPLLLALTFFPLPLMLNVP